jgi:hypothetical protein
MNSSFSTTFGIRPRVGALSILAAFAVLSCAFLTGCDDTPSDPRTVYDDLEDADDLRPAVAESLDAANAALSLDGHFTVVGSWQDVRPRAGGNQVRVYLLRRRILIKSVENSLKAIAATIEDFHSDLANTTVDPRYENCADTDPCAALLYAGTRMAGLATDVYRAFSSVDSAVTESDCRCAILMEDDLRRFELVIGPSITGEHSIPITWYIPWYVLHEVGHLDSRYRLVPSPSWEALYHRAQNGLNQAQLEEMRADAYAASLLGKACLKSSQVVRDTVGSACLGLALQALQLWSYLLFDKTESGLRRQYLGDGQTHPNFLMRLLVMDVVMTDGDEHAINLLSDLLAAREALTARLAPKGEPSAAP